MSNATATESAPDSTAAETANEDQALTMIVDLETRLAAAEEARGAAQDLAHQLEASNDNLARMLDTANADVFRLTAAVADAQAAIVKVQTDSDRAFTKALADARKADADRLSKLQLFNVDRSTGRTLVAAEGFNEALALVLAKAPETADDRIRGIALAGMGFLI